MTEADVLDLVVVRSACISLVTVRLGAGGVRPSWSKTPLPALTNLGELQHAAAFCVTGRERILLDNSAPTALKRVDGNWGPAVRQLGGPFVGVDVSVQALAAVFDQHPVVSHARGRTTGGRGASSSCGRWRATSCRTSCLCLLRHSRPSRGTSCASHLRHHRLDWFRSPFSPGTVGSRSARRCRRPTSLRRGPECSASSGGGRRR